MLGAPFATEPARQLGMRLSKDHREPRHEPSGHNPNLLHHAFLDPEQELVRLLQHATRRHCATSPAMPMQVTFLLFDRLLKHGLQPTISAGYESPTP
jgi:hypothetical protein